MANWKTRKKSSQSCTRSWPNRRREHSRESLAGWMTTMMRQTWAVVIEGWKRFSHYQVESRLNHYYLKSNLRISCCRHTPFPDLTIICIRSSQEPRTWRWIFFLSLIRSTIDLFFRWVSLLYWTLGEHVVLIRAGVGSKNGEKKRRQFVDDYSTRNVFSNPVDRSFLMYRENTHHKLVKSSRPRPCEVPVLETNARERRRIIISRWQNVSIKEEKVKPRLEFRLISSP